MAHVTLEVPAVLMAPLRDSLVLLYHATAESLHLALRAHVERRAPVDAIHEHRDRLAQLDALIGQVGWSPATASRGAALRGQAEVVRDAVHGALIDAGERLAAAAAGVWDGEAGLDDVSVLAREVIALDQMIRRLERDGGAEAGARPAGA